MISFVKKITLDYIDDVIYKPVCIIATTQANFNIILESPYISNYFKLPFMQFR